MHSPQRFSLIAFAIITGERRSALESLKQGNARSPIVVSGGYSSIDAISSALSSAAAFIFKTSAKIFSAIFLLMLSIYISPF